MFGKVLLVDDTKENLEELKSKLELEFYDVVVCDKCDEVLSTIEEDRPDLIIIDSIVANSRGFELCEEIKSNSETFYLPIIMITTFENEQATIRALEIGADDIIARPINDTALFARVNSLLRLKMMAEQWIIRETALQDKIILPDHLDTYFGKKCKYSHVMIIGKTDEGLRLLREPLEEKKYKVIYTKSVDDAETFANYKKLDLFVVDLEMGGQEALQFCAKLKSGELNKNTPILIVGKEADEKVLVKALEIGCNDYIVYPFNGHAYLARVYTQLKKNKYQEQLEKKYQKSMSLASIDELTGVSNRRYLQSYMVNIFEEMKTKQKKLAVLMMDIDDFKTINDTYGHLVGDEVLVEFSKRLKEEFRDFDLIARYGGDEFVAVIPYVTEEMAIDISERVKESIGGKSFKVSVPPHQVNVSISIGLSITEDFEGKTSEELIEESDKSLYDAKDAGKNKVCVSWQKCQ